MDDNVSMKESKGWISFACEKGKGHGTCLEKLRLI